VQRQCKLVSDKLGLVHISAGDVLREAAAEGTPMGLRAKECMDKGELVPTEVRPGALLHSLNGRSLVC
jgi:adenylate kinase